MEHKKKVAIVGIGMDGTDTLTQAGRRAIEAADLLIGAERMLRPFRHLGKREVVSYQPAPIICDCEEQHIAVLVSGDVGFYSAAEKLLPRLEGLEVEVICGIATPVYFSARLGLSWSDMHFVSLHGANASIVRNVCAHKTTFFLLGGDVTPALLCRRLCEYGLQNVTVHIGENLSSDAEHVTSGCAKDFTEYEAERLCAVIVQNEQYERGIRAGIDDSEFIRGDIPMTKSEVRTLVVAKLGIGEGDVCWDIGCGTGSVSVEMALRGEDVSVYAVDKNAEAVALTQRNCEKFGCDNIEIIHEKAETAVSSFPPPDCVFIGGSGGSIEPIVQAAYAKNPAVRMVVTAVSLETLHQAATVFEQLGMACAITQIAVTRTRKVGSHTMLAAENPIFIIQRKL